jgi:hypothetical protein
MKATEEQLNQLVRYLFSSEGVGGALDSDHLERCPGLVIQGAYVREMDSGYDLGGTDVEVSADLSCAHKYEHEFVYRENFTTEESLMEEMERANAQKE